ncbi:MAG: hypothetical protein VXX70_05475, partial [Bacteroidota bacterium]|nr:hypothetical protein [Bacteroidota bacterium]
PGGRKDLVVECVGHFETRRFESVSSPKLYPAGQVVRRYIGLDAELETRHIALVMRIKEILSERDIDVAGLPSTTISDITTWLGLPPAHKHRLLTSNDEERSDFMQSVLRWTLSILQQESRIDKGFFPN